MAGRGEGYPFQVYDIDMCADVLPMVQSARISKVPVTRPRDRKVTPSEDVIFDGPKVQGCW